MGAVEQETRTLGDEFWSLFWHRIIDKYGRPREIAKIAREAGVSEFTLREQEEHRRLPRNLQTAMALATYVGITREELKRFYPVLETWDKGRYPKMRNLRAL